MFLYASDGVGSFYSKGLKLNKKELGAEQKELNTHIQTNQDTLVANLSETLKEITTRKTIAATM